MYSGYPIVIVSYPWYPFKALHTTISLFVHEHLLPTMYCLLSDINDHYFCVFPVTHEGQENIVMYVGLVVAIAVFITVVIIIVFLLRRKRAQPGMKLLHLQDRLVKIV